MLGGGLLWVWAARRMQRMGVKEYVIAPQNWDEAGKRQVKDKDEAQVICRRVSEYLAGDDKAPSTVIHGCAL